MEIGRLKTSNLRISNLLLLKVDFLTMSTKNQPNKLQQDLNWYLSLVVIFLLLVLPPIFCGLLYLSRVPDITLGDGAPTYTRVWMHRERRPVGLGIETRRVTEEYSPTEICVQNRLRFFLWGRSPSADPATTEQRMTLVAGQWQPTGERCE